MDTEDKNQEIRKKLRSLPKIKASDDFMTKLQHKINLLELNDYSLETEKEEKAAGIKGFWLFRKPMPAWLIPAAGFGIVIIIVFSFWMIYKGTPDSSEQNISEQKSAEQTITSTEEQKTPEIKKPDDISNKDLALDINRDKSPAEEKLSIPPEPKSFEQPEIKEPVEKITNDKTEDTKALPPLNSTNNGQKIPDTKIKDENFEAKEPEVKKEEERAVVKESEKKNVNAIKSEKGIDFYDKNDVMKDKTGVMEEKKKNKDGIRSKIDSVKKGFDK